MVHKILPLIRNTIFLISKSYSVVHKMLSLIGNEVWGLNRDTQLKATDSLNIHVNSAMLVANGWRQIAFWVPNPHIALLSISNNVIFFPQCFVLDLEFGNLITPKFSQLSTLSKLQYFEFSYQTSQQGRSTLQGQSKQIQDFEQFHCMLLSRIRV